MAEKKNNPKKKESRSEKSKKKSLKEHMGDAAEQLIGGAIDVAVSAI